MSLCWGMASTALLMSTVVKSALCAGLFELLPSKMCCVGLVSRVFVEWSKPVLCGCKGDIRVDYVQYKAFCDFGWCAEACYIRVFKAV